MSTATSSKGRSAIETASAELMEPILKTLRSRTTPPSDTALEAQGRMSRRRFAITQCTSILGGLIFLIGIVIYSLAKIEGLSDVVMDKCENSTSLSALCRLVQVLAKSTTTQIECPAAASCPVCLSVDEIVVNKTMTEL